MKPKTCKNCGSGIYLVDMHPKNQGKPGWKRFVFLNMDMDHAQDNVTITKDGYAVYDDIAGEYTEHKCPQRVSKCKYCYQPVKIVLQPPGSPCPMAVIEANPDPRGNVVIVGQYAVSDPDHEIHGERYRWHDGGHN